MALGDPKRVRTAVRDRGEHVGYVTIVSYPDRDLTFFPEGTPYAEVVVSDLADRHVALFQRFKEHWLVHCGTNYATTDAAGDLTDRAVWSLATFALRHRARPNPVLAGALKKQIERSLR
jgi:hypothetical protein